MSSQINCKDKIISFQSGYSPPDQSLHATQAKNDSFFKIFHTHVADRVLPECASHSLKTAKPISQTSAQIDCIQATFQTTVSSQSSPSHKPLSEISSFPSLAERFVTFCYHTQNIESLNTQEEAEALHYQLLQEKKA